MLLALLPVAFEFLAVGIVKHTWAKAVIIFELSFVGLTIGPHIGAKAMLLALVEISEEQSSIGPLKEALPMHSIIAEWPLIYLAS